MTINIADLLNKKEDLHPDLQVQLVVGRGKAGQCLKHPLLFAIPYIPEMNAIYNAQYLARKEAVEKAVKEKKWIGAIAFHERPHRLEVFREIEQYLSDEEYWELLGDLWTDSENLWQQSDLESLLGSDRMNKEMLMDERERKFFNELPDEVKLYRGHQRKNRRGFSWSLSYWKARWFAHRFHQKGYVDSVMCNKEDIHAVFLGRKEFEAIVSPDKVKGKPFKAKRGPFCDLMWHEAVKQFQLGDSSIHGPWHWEKVFHNAVTLAKMVRGAHHSVCRLFAIFHDCKRENEYSDPDHGHRAADFVKSLQVPALTSYEAGLLDDALRHHNDGNTSTNPTIGACWDADRLDLPRVGKVPDPKFLSTDAGKQMLWRI